MPSEYTILQPSLFMETWLSPMVFADPAGGPEQITQREAVEIFSKAFGQPFSITEIPAEALRAQWQSAEDPFQKSFSALMLDVAEGWGAAPPPDPERFPMQMTSIADFAARQAR